MMMMISADFTEFGNEITTTSKNMIWKAQTSYFAGNIKRKLYQDSWGTQLLTLMSSTKTVHAIYNLQYTYYGLIRSLRQLL